MIEYEVQAHGVDSGPPYCYNANNVTLSSISDADELMTKIEAFITSRGGSPYCVHYVTPSYATNDGGIFEISIIVNGLIPDIGTVKDLTKLIFGSGLKVVQGGSVTGGGVALRPGNTTQDIGTISAKTMATAYRSYAFKVSPKEMRELQAQRVKDELSDSVLHITRP